MILMLVMVIKTNDLNEEHFAIFAGVQVFDFSTGPQQCSDLSLPS